MLWTHCPTSCYRAVGLVLPSHTLENQGDTLLKIQGQFSQQNILTFNAIDVNSIVRENNVKMKYTCIF